MGPRILVTGALGQIGTELVEMLCTKFGEENIVATDVRESSSCRFLDVMDLEAIDALVESEEITEIYHLAALLSATQPEDYFCKIIFSYLKKYCTCSAKSKVELIGWLQLII